MVSSESIRRNSRRNLPSQVEPRFSVHQSAQADFVFLRRMDSLKSVKLGAMQFLQSPLLTPVQSAQEYGRGLAGGLIFSLPLLFTMEVWEASWRLEPARLAFYLVATGAVLLLYNRFGGLRGQSSSWWECAIDSVEELGLGLVLAAGIFWLIGNFEGRTSLEIGAQIVMGGMTVAIGVSVGTAQLGAQSEDSEENEEENGGQTQNGTEKEGFLAQLALSFCGAILIAANIAPTEEVLMVAEGISPLKLLLIALFSLLIGAYILFFAAFRGTQPLEGSFARFDVLRLMISTYAVALCASAATLFFFGRFDGETPALCAAQTVVVGLAASLGASAGRLLLQGDASGNGN